MDRKQVPKTPSPHDQFFKGVFSQPEIAESYIRSFLPKEIWQNLTLDQLKLDNTSYVTSELKAYFSDLVWQCPYHDSEINIAFCSSIKPINQNMCIFNYSDICCNCGNKT